ncbi:MAG: hypothetical protein ACK5L3_04045 [Oscillospiraceae bacterium]
MVPALWAGRQNAGYAKRQGKLHWLTPAVQTTKTHYTFSFFPKSPARKVLRAGLFNMGHLYFFLGAASALLLTLFLPKKGEEFKAARLNFQMLLPLPFI